MSDGPHITPRQWETLLLLLDGLPNKQIASRMAIGTKTVEKHRQALYKKLEVDSPIRLLIAATKRGYIDVEDWLAGQPMPCVVHGSRLMTRQRPYRPLTSHLAPE